jgi:hypothetical protein
MENKKIYKVKKAKIMKNNKSKEKEIKIKGKRELKEK